MVVSDSASACGSSGAVGMSPVDARGRAPSPWTKERSCFVRVAPQLAAFAISSRSLRMSGVQSPSRSRSVVYVRTIESALFKSCATPLATVPMAISLSASQSRSSAGLRVCSSRNLSMTIAADSRRSSLLSSSRATTDGKRARLSLCTTSRAPARKAAAAASSPVLPETMTKGISSFISSRVSRSAACAPNWGIEGIAQHDVPAVGLKGVLHCPSVLHCLGN